MPEPMPETEEADLLTMIKKRSENTRYTFYPWLCTALYNLYLNTHDLTPYRQLIRELINFPKLLIVGVNGNFPLMFAWGCQSILGILLN